MRWVERNLVEHVAHSLCSAQPTHSYRWKTHFANSFWLISVIAKVSASANLPSDNAFLISTLFKMSYNILLRNLGSETVIFSAVRAFSWSSISRRSWGVTIFSIRSRSARAIAGLLPLVETATFTSPTFATAGSMKSLSAGLSTAVSYTHLRAHETRHD